MIPRSDRVIFHLEPSPEIKAKNASPPSLANMETKPSEASSGTSATRWNSSKRITIAKESRKPRVVAPATPWRSRTSHRPPSTAADEHHFSPLDRKAAGSTLKLELGAKSEPVTVSSAPTSATLVAGGEKERQSAMEADAYRHTLQPVAPTMERGEEWRSDRWRLLRPEPNSAADSFNRHVHARTDAYRQDQAAFNCPPQRTGLGVGSAAYQASARSAEMCWPSDKNNETNVYVNGLPEE